MMEIWECRKFQTENIKTPLRPQEWFEYIMVSLILQRLLHDIAL